MRAYLLVAGAALALSACQSAEEKRAAETGEIEATNASMEQISDLTKAARTRSRLEPGIWQTEIHVLATDFSGFPEGAEREAQRAAIKAQERSASGCRTADDLKPFDFDNLAKVAGTCSFPRYIQKGGQIDVEIVCGEDAAKTIVRARGTLGPTGYDVTMDQTSGTPGAANYLAFKLQAKGRRTGSCVPKAQG